MLTPAQLTALDAAASEALRCQATTNLPAGLTVAQWALESGWGHYAPGNNCFGIKYYAGAAGSQWLATHEYVAGKPTPENLLFATFPTLQACFEKHAALITKGAPYRAAWARYVLSRDVEMLVRDIAPHYAPGNPGYAESVLSVLHMLPVEAALKPRVALS